jgi:hypothetical protein
MKVLDHILSHSGEFLDFLRGRVPVFHLSNIFFRDIHYAIMAFAALHGPSLDYTGAEDVARQVIEKLEKDKVIVRIDRQTWVVHKEEFRRPNMKPAAAAPAKPAATAAQPA